MLLAIDIGNTNIVLGLYDLNGSAAPPPTHGAPRAGLRAHWRLDTRASRTGDEYAALLGQLFAIAGHKLGDVTAVVVSSVVPPALFPIERLCRDYLGREPLVVGPGIKTGIPVLYDNPKEVGADRIVNAVAAHARWPQGTIVVDFGTATTFDIADYSGAYKGGIIAPGINLSLDALVAAAAKLPRIAIEAPRSSSVIGRTTEDQMLIGIYFGYIAMIEGLVARLRAEVGRPIKVISTGGLAPLFEQHSSIFDVIEPDLTIQGLGILYRRQTAGT
jgi:type III pantothenate kinase